MCLGKSTMEIINISNQNMFIIYQNVWDVARAVLTRDFIA